VSGPAARGLHELRAWAWHGHGRWGWGWAWGWGCWRCWGLSFVGLLLGSGRTSGQQATPAPLPPPPRIALSFATVYLLWDIKPIFYAIWTPFKWLVAYDDPRRPRDDNLYGGHRPLGPAAPPWPARCAPAGTGAEDAAGARRAALAGMRALLRTAAFGALPARPSSGRATGGAAAWQAERPTPLCAHLPCAPAQHRPGPGLEGVTGKHRQSRAGGQLPCSRAAPQWRFGASAAASSLPTPALFNPRAALARAHAHAPPRSPLPRAQSGTSARRSTATSGSLGCCARWATPPWRRSSPT
jgi:hypothetical protein